VEGLEVGQDRDLGNFIDFFLKLVNFGCVEVEEAVNLRTNN
jgi:hypothetical protein